MQGPSEAAAALAFIAVVVFAAKDNATEETGIRTAECPVGTFACNASSFCVHQEHICDNVWHCSDGSDERNCLDKYIDDYIDGKYPKRPDADLDQLDNSLCVNIPTLSACRCSKFTVDCSQKGITSVPKNVPLRTRFLHLSFNEIGAIDANDFRNLTHLEKLIMMNSHVTNLSSGTLSFNKQLNILHLSGNDIEDINNLTFITNSGLTELDISRNKLTILRNTYFQGLHGLLRLRLGGNKISHIDDGTFHDLRKLNFLYLGENKLSRIRIGIFTGLSNLTYLMLDANRITHIEPGSFRDLHSLRKLMLKDNSLRYISGGMFEGLSNLRYLDLRKNQLTRLDNISFDHVPLLESLYLGRNELTNLNKRIFQNLDNLDYIMFSEFRHCAFARHVRVCLPKGDGISSQEHLLDNVFLRVGVWIIAIIACIGNILVIVGRVLVKEDDRVHSFLIKNMALADFVMGVYLFVIAFQDVRFRGEYIQHLVAWQSSPLCDVCGVLSTISSEVSVFILTLVTLDRYTCIIYPLQIRKRRFVHVAYLLALTTWLFWLIVATFPVLPIRYFGDTFYSNNGVCLALHIHDPFADGWQFSAGVFIGVNSVAFTFIVYAYVRMFVAIRASKLSLRSTHGGQDASLVQRFFFIVLTDFLCWVPVIVVKSLALSGIPIAAGFYGWIAVFILPVNSALNPVLYTLTTKMFKRHFLFRLRGIGRRSTTSEVLVYFRSVFERRSSHRKEVVTWRRSSTRQRWVRSDTMRSSGACALTHENRKQSKKTSRKEDCQMKISSPNSFD